MARNCSGCKEKRPAHSLCTNCNKWLCSLCTEEHSHSKETGEHFLPVSLKGCSGVEGEANEYPLFCPIHSQERLKLFCETCDVLTCRCCLLTEHKDHRFRHLQEALQNQRAILENITCKVEEKKNVMQVSAKHIEDRLFEAKHLQRKIENQIKMAKMVLISEINKRTNVLLEQLERITCERKQKMEQQLQSIMVLNRQFEHVQNFLSWAVCSKSTVPFLFSKELATCQWKGGPSHHSDVPTYASIQGIQPSLYHHHGHHSPVPQHDPLNNQPHQFQPPVHCLAPMCCAHCLNIPHMNKGQLSHQTVSHPQAFRQPSEMQQHHPQHFPVQYSLQQHEREQRCAPRVLKSMQPCAEQKSHQESDSLTTRLGKNSHEQPMHHALPSIYPLSSQDGHQSQGSHSQQLPAQSSLPSPTVQVQGGPLQKLKLNNLQPQQQPLPPPPPPPQPQPQPQPPQQEHPLPPPLSPQQSPAASPNEKAHDQVVQQSLDIMHHQFELEEMKKDLELLLQAQQPSLQLNQAKQPQHVQQTIVGQINYIVRQPATVQQQNQEEVQQIGEESAESEGQKPPLPLDRNVIPSMSQPGDEATVNMQSPESILSPVRKRSASMNIVGFPNILEVDLSSTRAPRQADSQAKEICSATPNLSQNVPHVTEMLPESISTYNMSLDRTRTLSSENIEHLAIGGMPLVNPVCKLENEEYSHVSYPLGSNIVTAQSKGMNEMALPLQNILEEPINLSVKKTQPCTSPPLLISNTTFMQSVNPKPGHTEDCPNYEEEHFEKEIKSSQNNRICAKEVKIPYVRLERLKICTSESGELPIFKLQPQKSTHDGTFLLIIECGTQSSSMAIKVNQGHSSESLNPKLGEKLEKSRILTSQLSEQVLLPSGDHRLSNNVKKSGLPQEEHPIENEDFCAVCLNGGELLCCDYCPKVFHLSCHVPALLSFPVGEWVCTLCRNVENPEVVYDCENTRFDYNTLMQARPVYSLGEYDQKKCEKLVLSLFCNSLSLPFHEPVSPLARHYYQIIKKPMDLSIIRKKLQKKIDKLHYTSSEELVSDVRLMFWNCATFNYPDSEVAEAGRCLEIFFESKLKEIYPERRFPLVQQDDSDLEDVEHENSQATTEGLQWPSYRQECIQPKRRRRHAENEKPKRPMFWPAKSFSQV